MVLSDHHADLIISIGHFANGILFLVAPSFGASFYAEAHYGAPTVTDIEYGYWMGIWLTLFAFVFHYGHRTQNVFRTFFFCSGPLVVFSALFGHAGVAMNVAKLLPYNALFMALSISRAGILKPFALPHFWSGHLTRAQNIFRIYVLVASIVFGIAYYVDPAKASVLYQVHAPSGIGLAFSTISAAVALAIAVVVIETDSRIFLRNYSAISGLLFLSVGFLFPGRFPVTWLFCAGQIAGAAIAHFNM